MKIKSYFLIEEKCEDGEKLILRNMSHAMVVLFRAWGHFILVRTPLLRQLQHETGKYEKRENAEKNAGSCAAEFLPTHRAGRNSARRLFIYRKSETESRK
jgi:hypothetical protein